ncbi:hypothetical protein DMC30DRAFT_393174 [Rhodotorula diobovata]|uniref:Uncharacterized protein n=1 Tax=Rhodotorula diobovata TaxID=5288 RepID=A0A5C5G1A9_9BASI|nr:hypothetical protein DMC30DRAFT_393174 [Rhodotorula diobovata]
MWSGSRGPAGDADVRGRSSDCTASLSDSESVASCSAAALAAGLASASPRSGSRGGDGCRPGRLNGRNGGGRGGERGAALHTRRADARPGGCWSGGGDELVGGVAVGVGSNRGDSAHGGLLLLLLEDEDEADASRAERNNGLLLYTPLLVLLRLCPRFASAPSATHARLCFGLDWRLGSGVGENVTRRFLSASAREPPVLLDDDDEEEEDDDDEEERTSRGEGASPEGAFSLPLVEAVEAVLDAPRRVKVGLTEAPARRNG